MNDAQISEAVIRAIRETFIGANGDDGAFLRKQDPGLLPLMSLLTAADASRPIAGASIAAHVSHIIICLDSFLSIIAGTASSDSEEWKETLCESQVDDNEWQVLQEELEIRMNKVVRIVSKHTMHDEAGLWAALGILAHNAYHLGAIQAKLEQINFKS